MCNVRYAWSTPDTVAYFDLFETTGWNETYRLTLAEVPQTLAATWRIRCAYTGSGLIGVGRLVSDGVLYAAMFDIIVTPTLQRKGVGTRIVKDLLEECRAAGIRDVMLFAAKGTDSFYARFGFRRRSPEAPGMLLRRVDGS